MDYPVCTPKQLPAHLLEDAAVAAILENPANEPDVHGLTKAMGRVPTALHIAGATTSLWRNGGVNLSVQFLDSPDQATMSLILEHMNAWGTRANVKFSQTNGTGQVRIARQSGQQGGYWSYIGTDILQIPAGQPTMNLEGFTSATPISEYKRVVRHETGHTMGFVHEHMRPELVALLDIQKTLAYFEATQGWSAAEVQQQVLTPLDPSQLTALAPDQVSIMCYQLPGSITKNGQAILGGTDIDEEDYQLASQLYPLVLTPTGPTGPTSPPVVTASYSVDQAVTSVNKAISAVMTANPRLSRFLAQLGNYIIATLRADAPGNALEVPMVGDLVAPQAQHQKRRR